jgi:hypothetical protein
MAKTQIGQCALCRQNKELQLSHIVPNFVGRCLKNTSPGSIRVTNEPNKVAQDIEDLIPNLCFGKFALLV